MAGSRATIRVGNQFTSTFPNITGVRHGYFSNLIVNSTVFVKGVKRDSGEREKERERRERG